MKKVTIDGEVYTKASVLAKEFGYTSDYVGQLCRAEKVDAKLVGRSWYVNGYSLSKHKDSRYESLRSNEIISKTKVLLDSDSQPEKILIKPVLSKTTRRTALISNESNWSNHVTEHKIAHYEHDGVELLPAFKVVKSKDKPTPVPVELASSIKVPINKKSEKPYKLNFSDMPAVSLSGKLDIKDLDADYAETKPDLIKTTPVVPDSHKISKVRITTPESFLNVPKSKRVSFTPENISSSAPAKTNSSKVLILVSIVSALFVAFLTLTIDTQIVSSGNIVYHRLIFNTASLANIFTILGF